MAFKSSTDKLRLSRLEPRLEVLDIWGNDDVYVLRSADHPPGVDRQPTDQHELDVCLREPA